MSKESRQVPRISEAIAPPAAIDPRKTTAPTTLPFAAGGAAVVSATAGALQSTDRPLAAAARVVAASSCASKSDGLEVSAESAFSTASSDRALTRVVNDPDTPIGR